MSLTIEELGGALPRWEAKSFRNETADREGEARLESGTMKKAFEEARWIKPVLTEVLRLGS